MDRGRAPQGLQNSAQGFNPGNPQNEWFALKGREMRAPHEPTPISAQSQSAQLGGANNCTIGLRFRLVRRFDLAHPSGRAALGGRIPGLKAFPFRRKHRGFAVHKFSPPTSSVPGSLQYLRPAPHFSRRSPRQSSEALATSATQIRCPCTAPA